MIKDYNLYICSMFLNDYLKGLGKIYFFVINVYNFFVRVSRRVIREIYSLYVFD